MGALVDMRFDCIALRSAMFVYDVLCVLCYVRGYALMQVLVLTIFVGGERERHITPFYSIITLPLFCYR